MILKNRSRIATAEQELAEIRRRGTNERALKHRADGLPYMAQIRKAHRHDWTRRFTAAMSAAEESEEEREVCRSVGEPIYRSIDQPGCFECGQTHFHTPYLG